MADHKNLLNVLGPISQSTVDASILVFRASAALRKACDNLHMAHRDDLATPIAAVRQDIYSREMTANPEYAEDSRSKVLPELPSLPYIMTSPSAYGFFSYLAVCRLVGAASCLMRAGHEISALRVRALKRLFEGESFYEDAVKATLQVVDGNLDRAGDWIVSQDV